MNIRLHICMWLCLCCVTITAQQRHSDVLDDILQYVPTAASFTLRATGIQSNIPFKEALIGKCFT
ncbi:MAG: hypothetical protein IIT94_11520, partial [Prevotella sp.]|nr:hypothetical protein [Prevotella sp.]